MSKEKMTRKEFIEILEKADCKIYADYEVLLNVLSVFLLDMSEKSMRLGDGLLSIKEKEKRDVIYKELLRRGFYDDLICEVKP